MISMLGMVRWYCVLFYTMTNYYGTLKWQAQDDCMWFLCAGNSYYVTEHTRIDHTHISLVRATEEVDS